MKADNDNAPSWVVYTLSDSRKPDVVRYVGITNNPTGRLSSHRSDAVRREKTYKANWIRSVLSAGGDIAMNILRQDLSHSAAVSGEIELIAAYRADGHRLTNLTNGGEGAPGVIVSEKTRAKLSAAFRGQKRTHEARARMSKAQRGRSFSDESRAKMSKTRIGMRPTEETRAKMSISQSGKKLSQEQKLLLSISARRRPPGNSIGLKGVAKKSGCARWEASIRVDGHAVYLGSHATQEDAARAYDKAAFAAWGSDCYLNFKNELEVAA